MPLAVDVTKQFGTQQRPTLTNEEEDEPPCQPLQLLRRDRSRLQDRLDEVMIASKFCNPIFTITEDFHLYQRAHRNLLVNNTVVSPYDHRDEYVNIARELARQEGVRDRCVKRYEEARIPIECETPTAPNEEI